MTLAMLPPVIVGVPVRSAPAAGQKDAARLAANGLKAFEQGKFQEAIESLGWGVDYTLS